MKFEDINFPVYRKYKNNKSYFKIMNPRSFEEIQVIGSKKIIKIIEATLYPEIMFVSDLLLHYHEMADEINEADYQLIKN